jgi:hypothetical protein
MVDPVTAALIGAGTGLAKGIGGGIEAARRDRINAEQGALDTAFGPFVGRRGNQVTPMEAPSILGSLATGALGGFQQGLEFEKAPLAKQQLQSQADAMRNEANLYKELQDKARAEAMGLKGQ